MPYSHLAKRSQHASKSLSFFYGILQMVLISSNFRNIANGHLVFAFAFTIINTYVIVYGARMIIHSKPWEIFCYAIGSAIGSVTGIVFHYYVIEPYAFTKLATLIGL